jgi:hypothetical protein
VIVEVTEMRVHVVPTPLNDLVVTWSALDVLPFAVNVMVPLTFPLAARTHAV